MTGNNIVEEIRLLKEKAVRYDNLKERNMGYIKTINNMIEQLNDLKKQIDPFGADVTQTTRKNFKEIRKIIFDRLEGGEEFTIEKIQTEFSLVEKQPYALFRELLKNRNISKRTDGRKITIYANKNV